MEETVGQRIRRTRKEKGVSQQELADAVGVSRAAVSQWETGSTESLDSKHLMKAAKKLDVNPAWLHTGEEGSAAHLPVKSKAEAVLADEAEQAKVLANDFVLVPRYDVKASMGNGHIVHSEEVVDLLAFKRNWVQIELGVDPRNLALISTIGDSMEPALRPGDIILLDKSIHQVKGDAIYVINFDGELLAKRVQKLFDGSMVIKSDNPAYEPQKLSQNDAEMVRIVGRVVWAGRRM